MRAVSGFAALVLLGGCAPQSRPSPPPPVLVAPTVSSPEAAPAPPRIQSPAAAPMVRSGTAAVPPSSVVVQQAPRGGSSVRSIPTAAPPRAPQPAATPLVTSTPAASGPPWHNADEPAPQSDARPTPGRQQILDYADWVRRAEAERYAIVQRSTARNAGAPASFTALFLNPDGQSLNAEALNAMRTYLQQVRRTKPSPPLPCTMFDRFYGQWLSEQELTTDALVQGSANPAWLANKDARIDGLGVAADQELTKLAALYHFPKEFTIRH